MERQGEDTGAAAQQQIDFAATFATLETTRNNLSSLCDQYKNFDATFSAQSDAYNKLRIAYEELTTAHTNQSTQLASLNAEVAQVKADNQSLTQNVRSLESTAASQLQAYKNLEKERDEHLNELIRVSEELREQKVAGAAARGVRQEQPPQDDLETGTSLYEEIFSDASKELSNLRAANDEHLAQTIAKSAYLETMRSRCAGLGKANETLLHSLETTQRALSRKSLEYDVLRRSDGAQSQRVAELRRALSTKEAAYEQLSTAHRSQGSQLADLDALLNSQSSELAYYRQEQEAWTREEAVYKAASATDYKRYNDLNRRYDEVKTSLFTLDTQNKTLQADLKNLQSAFYRLQVDKEKLDERNEKLQVEMRGVQETKAYQSRLAKRLGDENIKLKSDCDKLQRETTQAQAVQLPDKRRKVEGTYWEPYSG